MLSTIIGHDSQRSFLAKLFFAGQIPSTIMLCGIPGIGKALVARELARSLFCETLSEFLKKSSRKADLTSYGGCERCKACHLFQAGNSPDFYQIECLNKEEGAVSELRDLLYALNLRSFSGTNRVVFINDADHLSLQGANILLKTLEEPRPATFFILVASNPSNLPATLISRCQVWHFDRLSNKSVQEVLQRYPIELSEEESSVKPDIEELVALADGSLESLKNLSQHYTQWLHLQETIQAIFKGNVQAAIQLANELGKNREALRDNLRLIRILTRYKMRSTHVPDEQARWAVGLTNSIAAERFIFDRNLSATYVITCMLLGLISSTALPSFTTLTNSATVLEKIAV